MNEYITYTVFDKKTVNLPKSLVEQYEIDNIKIKPYLVEKMIITSNGNKDMDEATLTELAIIGFKEDMEYQKNAIFFAREIKKQGAFDENS